jgi:cytochrome c
MKKIFYLVITVSLFGCNENKNAAQSKTESAQQSNTLAGNPIYLKGTELFYKNDCGTCHADKVKMSGPSYAEIATKYNADTTMITTLANRIIKGGKGVWGEIPMTAHPNLSKEDAEALVRYIYLFRE